MSEMWRKCGVEKGFLRLFELSQLYVYVIRSVPEEKIDENQSEGIVSRERNRGFRNQKGRQDDL